jgi:hypothetical protein
MGDYDRTCIVVCLEQGGSPKQTAGARGLKDRIDRKGKHNCSIVEMPSDLSKTITQKTDSEVAQLTDQSRLYILGECSHPGGTLSGMVPGHLTERLVDKYGLKAAAKVVLVACEAGGLPNDFTNWSFAKAFHHLLRTPFGISTVVAAFNRTVFVATEDYVPLLPKEEFTEAERQPGVKFVERYPAKMVGRDRVPDDRTQPTPAKRVNDCKVLWYWEGTNQRCGYWDYNSKTLIRKY